MSIVGATLSPLSQLEYIKGAPPSGGLGAPVPEGHTRVVVVEFWATWCPPCRTSIPHLSELAQKYKDKDVTIVGVSNEADKSTIASFVENMGDQMNYTVAHDPNCVAHAALMVPSASRGIPTAFIVVNNTITWHGHPMDPEFEKMLGEAADKASPAANSQAPEAKALPVVTESYEELMERKPTELRVILEERGISTAGLVEKADFAKKIVETCTTVTYYQQWNR